MEKIDPEAFHICTKKKNLSKKNGTERNLEMRYFEFFIVEGPFPGLPQRGKGWKAKWKPQKKKKNIVYQQMREEQILLKKKNVIIVILFKERIQKGHRVLASLRTGREDPSTG